MRRSLVGMLLLLPLGNAIAQGVYRWVDETGVVQFGDRPQAPSAEEIVLDRLNTVETPAVRPREAAQTQQPEIIMYSAQWCGVCKKAKAYFKQNKIKYTEYDVERSSKGIRDYQQMKVKSVPQFIVDGEKLRGFSRSRFEQLLGRGQS